MGLLTLPFPPTRRQAGAGERGGAERKPIQALQKQTR